jgi:protein-disulfide isomerase
MLPFALAGGSLIFVIVLVVLFLAVAFGYYTVRGSGISLTPYRRSGGPPESPPELTHDITQEVGNWERGTAGHHGGRHRPPASDHPVDPSIAAALTEWRASTREPRLDPPVGPDDQVEGPEGAPTVAVYVDLASEPCRSACRLLDDLGRERPVRIAVRHLPLADVHALALTAAEALEAAAAQGRFFEALDRLTNGGFTDESELMELAAASVPDGDRLRAEVEDGRHRGRIADQIRQATASGAHLIPEVYINGIHYDGDIRPEYLRRELASVDAAGG